MGNELDKIKERNKRVEADKAWETSKTRRLIIAVMTYVIIGIFLRSINVPNPWLNAIIPTIGFAISTFTLTVFKKLWLKYIHKQ